MRVLFKLTVFNGVSEKSLRRKVAFENVVLFTCFKTEKYCEGELGRVAAVAKASLVIVQYVNKCKSEEHRFQPQGRQPKSFSEMKKAATQTPTSQQFLMHSEGLPQSSPVQRRIPQKKGRASALLVAECSAEV